MRVWTKYLKALSFFSTACSHYLTNTIFQPSQNQLYFLVPISPTALWRSIFANILALRNPLLALSICANMHSTISTHSPRHQMHQSSPQTRVYSLRHLERHRKRDHGASLPAANFSQVAQQPSKAAFIRRRQDEHHYFLLLLSDSFYQVFLRLYKYAINSGN